MFKSSRYHQRLPGYAAGLAASFASLLFLSGCGKPAGTDPAAGTAAAPSLPKAELQTDWFAQGEHGGYYQALAKGYYKEQGIDLEIRQGGPSNYPVQLVATGQVAFAMGTSDGTMLAVNQGLPLVIVCAYMQHDPIALMLHEDNPINDFKQLDGKSVMIAPGQAWVAYLKQRFGVTINIIPLNFGLAQFMADKNFIQQCFVSSEPYFVRKAGGKPKTLLISDTGYDPYRVIFTSQKFAREHPEQVRAFVAASIKGYEDYLGGDPSPANKLILERNTKMDSDQIAFSRQAVIERKLVAGDPSKDQRIGLVTKRRMQEQMDNMVSLGMLPAALPLEKFVRFDFLPADYQALVEK